MSQNLLSGKLQNTNKGYGWIGGIIAGVALLKIPVVGVALGSFSVFMLLASLRSDEYKARKLLKKGKYYFNKEHYSYAYMLLKKAHELDDEKPEIMRMLIVSNIKLSKDPIESRILMDQITSKCTSHFSQGEIDTLKEMVMLQNAS